jgi:hypothetical protein
VYLYTMQYPEFGSDMFEEPGPASPDEMAGVMFQAQTGVSQAKEEMYSDSAESAESTYEDECPTNDKENKPKFRLGSQAPAFLWEHDLALYRLAHRLNLTTLCRETFVEMMGTKACFLARKDAFRYLNSLWSLDHEELDELKQSVVRDIARHDTAVIDDNQMGEMMEQHPDFARNLVKELRKEAGKQREKVKKQKRELVKLRKQVDSQGRAIEGLETRRYENSPPRIRRRSRQSRGRREYDE